MVKIEPPPPIKPKESPIIIEAKYPKYSILLKNYLQRLFVKF